MTSGGDGGAPSGPSTGAEVASSTSGGDGGHGGETFATAASSTAEATSTVGAASTSTGSVWCGADEPDCDGTCCSAPFDGAPICCVLGGGCGVDDGFGCVEVE